jgi:uncharacterized protein YggE
MNRQTMTCKVLLGILFTLSLLSPAHAVEDKEKSRTVTVQGQGKIQAVPDIATLSIEVTLEGSALDAVSAQVRERMQKALAALKAQGIDDKDIQTQAYQVQPRFEYDKAGNAKRKGYSVTHRVAAKVRDLKKVGKVLTSVLDTGVTSVDGPNFDFDNPDALERQALQKAVEDARSKAELLAHAAGATLGEILTLNQSGFSGPPGPRPMMMAMKSMAMTANAEEPISAGEQRFTASVSATFALK